jgi:hypothetical protein
MRILADLASHKITQVEKTPGVGNTTPFNGKYVVPVPEFATACIDSGAYGLKMESGNWVLDGGSVVSQGFADLLARYPMYEHIVFNPLLTKEDVEDLDPEAHILVEEGETSYPAYARYQSGRGGFKDSGQAPNSTALLPVNASVTPVRPGVLITKTIDIGEQTEGQGTDDFMVYWKIYDFETTHDVNAHHGALEGQNNPAIRAIKEIEQEPEGLEVSLSTNDGATYHPVGRMEPIDSCSTGKEIRLAFRNMTGKKIYIESYAIMF